MKLDILGVQAFVALAEHGSFVKAAEALFITQATLSRRLQNLEAFLGVRLVERTTRSRALTQVGEEFLPQAHGARAGRAGRTAPRPRPGRRRCRAG